MPRSRHSPTRRNRNAPAPTVWRAADAALADAFTTKILALARRVAGRPPPDFANLSFAELFAWSLAWPAAS